jgi:hypothetical protein
MGLQGKIISVTPTLDTNAYATGDHLGTLMTLSNAVERSLGSAILHGLTIIDKAEQKSAVDVLFFNSAPTIASADNAALDITDAEMAAKFIGLISVASADYKDIDGSSVATLRGLDLLLQSAKLSGQIANNDAKNLYAILCSRGSPTYAATDLVVKFHLVPA